MIQRSPHHVHFKDITGYNALAGNFIGSIVGSDPEGFVACEGYAIMMWSPRSKDKGTPMMYTSDGV